MTDILLISIIVIMLTWWVSTTRYWHTISVYLSRFWVWFIGLFKKG